MKSTIYHLSIIALCLAMVFTTACKKTAPQQQQQQHAVFQRSDFPTLKAGDWWRYRDSDAVNHTTDTIILSVVSATTHGGTQVWFCNIQKGNNIIDTAYISLSDTMMIYTEQKPSLFFLSTYTLKFPLDSGGVWASSDAHVMAVTGFINGFNVLGHNYDAFNVLKTYEVFNSIHGGGFQISKGIGIVEESYSSHYPDVYKNNGAQLIDYQLN